jgi:alpha,alpha-trehalase
MTGKRHSLINPKDYKKCLKYIEKCWDTVTFYHPRDHYIHFGLPHKFVSPNHGIYKDDQFYWDSYFIILGLVHSDRVSLAKGMIENFLFMQKRFNIIPMRNRYYNLGSSQIPFLTSMCREVYHVTRDGRWLRKVMLAAEYELKNYWMNTKIAELHNVYEGLSRYCDHYITHLAAEHESGWDMTSRFNERCLNYLPVDLNCALYKYERHIAAYYKKARKKRLYHKYIAQSEKRIKKMNELMWDEQQGFWFDFEYKQQKRSSFFSIAGFYPLWARIATEEQAKKMVEHLKLFEYEGGLASTQPTGLAEEYKQHDYPNGWPPHQWLVVKGLLNYGYRQDAERIAKKFLDLNKMIFEKTGKFWEKYNVVKCDVGDPDRYPTQDGFAWTNGVFIKMMHKFGGKP